MKIVSVCCTFLLLLSGSVGVTAQPYPAKPVRGIVAFGPGGQSDVVARIIAQKLSERWSQQVVIENRPGANGNIGTEAAVKSAPDGYTLYFPTSTVAVNAVIAPSNTYDPMKDLALITITGFAEAVMVVPTALPVRSVREYIDYAKKHPGELNYGTTSIGASGHIGMEQIKSLAGVRVEQVRYTNIGSLVTDLLSGRISVLIGPPASVIAHVQSGKLRAIGVTGTKRLELLPEVAPISETLPEFRVTSWYAIMAPAGTPTEIISKVNTDARWVLDQPDVRKRLAQIGVEAAGSPPDELRALMHREIEMIQKLVQSGALKRQE